MTMNKVVFAQRTITTVSEQTDSCILFCSLGKDSLVCLDLIYPRFKRIICVFMYFIRGLEHIERWIKWLKARYPKVEFIEVPHWNLTYILKIGLYSVPQPNLRLLKLKDVVYAIRLKYGIYHVFLGMKKADGMNRRLMLKGYEKQNYINNGMCYPLAEWTQKDVLAYMRMKRLPQPVLYDNKASNGIGFNLDCFKWMEEHYPQDLKRIYQVFPMSERILFEYYNEQNGMPKTDNNDGAK